MAEQRERFEAWWITQPDTHISQLIRFAKGEYSVAAQFAWEGWEAAEAPLLERIAELERQLVERKFVVELPEDWKFTQEDNDSYQAMVVGGQQMRELCKAAILAAGGEVR